MAAITVRAKAHTAAPIWATSYLAIAPVEEAISVPQWDLRAQSERGSLHLRVSLYTPLIN